jgi:hypothetical protein
VKHDAESHVEDRTFDGKDVGIPFEPGSPGPLVEARVGRTADGTDHVNVLTHPPFGLTLKTPSPELPARGPCAEAGTVKKSGVHADDTINKINETFVAGTFPRNVTFPAANILRLTGDAQMPEIAVECEVQGFAPEQIMWRLRVRHVLCRHYNARLFQYRSICRPLEAEWRGTSTATSFTLFSKAEGGDSSVTYDAAGNDAKDVVMGGYALLSIAARPPDGSAPVVAHAHLRIRGTNPSPDDVKTFLAELLKERDPNVLLIVQGSFIHESGLQQFTEKQQVRSMYVINKARHDLIRKKKNKDLDLDQPDCKVPFTFPYDPPGYPLVAFDFGVGISQYTQLSSQLVTAPVAWNWKENMKKGINLMFIKLKNGYPAPPGAAPAGKKAKKKPKKPPPPPPQTWLEWAMRGWQGYNGAPVYAERLSKTEEGRELAKQPAESFPKHDEAVANLKAFPEQEVKEVKSPWP